MRKTMTVLLVFPLLWLSGSLYAEKEGSEILIHKMDGRQVKGELIAVKKNSLLLMGKESGADVSVGIHDIQAVTIVKKSRVLKKGLDGLLLGGAIGLLIGYVGGSESKSGTLNIYTKEQTSTMGAAIGSVSGLLIGACVEAIKGKDKTIQLEGKSDPEIKQRLEDLRGKARITDFQ